MRWLALTLIACGAPEAASTAGVPCCLSRNVTEPSPWCAGGRAYICAPLDADEQPAPFCFAGNVRRRQGVELDVGACVGGGS